MKTLHCRANNILAIATVVFCVYHCYHSLWGQCYKTKLPCISKNIFKANDGNINMIKRFNGSNPASFSLFSLFSNTKFTKKTVSFSGIQTQIVSIEGKHPDHMTTTTALVKWFFSVHGKLYWWHTKQITQGMCGNIPYMFDYWTDQLFISFFQRAPWSEYSFNRQNIF